MFAQHSLLSAVLISPQHGEALALDLRCFLGQPRKKRCIKVTAAQQRSASSHTVRLHQSQQTLHMALGVFSELFNTCCFSPSVFYLGLSTWIWNLVYLSTVTLNTLDMSRDAYQVLFLPRIEAFWDNKKKKKKRQILKTACVFTRTDMRADKISVWLTGWHRAPRPPSDTQHTSMETIGTGVTEDIMIMRTVRVHTISKILACC